MAEIPPIPVRLRNRPTTGGLVRPWGNNELADGGVDFRGLNGTRWRQAWMERLCQVCGKPHESLMVFLGGPNQIRAGGYFDEPPIHPECAIYVREACPMVAGRMTHYRSGPSLSEGRRGQTCIEPGCACGGYRPSEQVLADDGSVTARLADAPGPAGSPAHAWYAVYARGYRIAVDPENRLRGGVPVDVVRTRQISTPKEDHDEDH
ncbi:hypothetical protein ACWDA3_25980 [Nonomuraea rubra]